MKYMVCREEAVHGGIKTSELFPCVVDVSDFRNWEPGEIALKAIQEKWPNYTPKNKSYYVVPMEGAVVVTFKPKVEFDIVVEQVV